MIDQLYGCILHNTIWDKVSADIKKEFDSDPVYNNFLQRKIRLYGDKATHDKKFLRWTLIFLSSNQLRLCSQ